MKKEDLKKPGGNAPTGDVLLREIQKTRPLYARVARDNTGSIRVLEKNGFVPAGSAVGYANAHGMEIEEVIMRLE